MDCVFSFEKQELSKTKNPPVYKLMDFCRGDRTRTCDSLVPNQERYQLRYTPKKLWLETVVLFKCGAKVHIIFELSKFFQDFLHQECEISLFLQKKSNKFTNYHYSITIYKFTIYYLLFIYYLVYLLFSAITNSKCLLR